ncbi:ARM repeat-containing protein [Martensiomyces pterosporus]|nr:ARM repeat-containing protein [Martensiomyces pterosporus]
MKEENGPVRAVAGLLLKNNVRQDFDNISPHVLDYVKRKSIDAIGDPDTLVRHTLGTVIATVVALGKIKNWPEILPRLMQLLDSAEYPLVEGAWDILRKICEECGHELEEPFEDGTRPLNVMLPKFLAFFSSESPILREYAISTTTLFVGQRSECMQPLMDTFVVELFKRANDDNAEVLKSVCKAVVALLESRPDKLVPELENVVNYMLHTTQNSNQEIAMEACEFWLSFCEQEELVGSLEPFLNKVIPTLMRGMVYSEEDLLMLDNDDDDAVVPDSEQDIKPRHHRARTHDHQTEGAGASSNDDGDSDENDDDDDDYDSDDDDDVYAEWNLRKCSAASLDVMSTVFGDRILEFVLPVLREELASDDWRVKEAGILALGAIAEGCMNGMEPHLPSLIPYLIQWFKHEKALVRSISCWSASRYGKWAVYGTEPNTLKVYFEPLLAGLLETMMDKNKRVQEAACSAFATVEEDAAQFMVPYIQPVLEALMRAFTQYQRKNLIILYDAVGTLAEAVGSELNQPQYIQMLMPQLLERWENVQTEDQHMFPLFECLSAIALSLGTGFKPFAQPVYERCVQIVGEALQLSQQASQDPTIEAPDKDLVIVALDLISAIIQALGDDAQALVAEHNGVVLQLVGMCMMDPVTDVRQSAFALLGDLAMHSFPLLLPQLDAIMQQLIPQVDRNFSHINVCNNAAWSVGEIALKAGEEHMKSYVNPLLERLVPLLNNENTPVTLAENAAITIGRLGLVCPSTVAPNLEVFAERWCAVLTNVRDNEEKSSAFQGMMTMIGNNPQGIAKAFLLFCQAAVGWQTPDAQLMDMFIQTFAGLKQLAGDNWEASMTMLDPQARELIMKNFHA